MFFFLINFFLFSQFFFLLLDCRRGQSLVVWAITEGRQAARQIDSYLIGSPSALPGPGGVIDPTRMP